jgi:hypothetical protein
LSATSGRMRSCSWPSMIQTGPPSSGSGNPDHLRLTLQNTQPSPAPTWGLR